MSKNVKPKSKMTVKHEVLSIDDRTKKRRSPIDQNIFENLVLQKESDSGVNYIDITAEPENK